MDSKKQQATSTHSMATRSKSSKSDVMSKKSVLGSRKSGLCLSGNKSSRSDMSVVSCAYSLNKEQLNVLFETKKVNSQKKYELERVQLEARLAQTKPNQQTKMLEESAREEELTLEKELQDFQQKQIDREAKRRLEEEQEKEDIVRRLRAIQEKNATEQRHLESRKCRDLQKLEERRQLLQYELEADMNETLAIRGFSPKSSDATNITRHSKLSSTSSPSNVTSTDVLSTIQQMQTSSTQSFSSPGTTIPPKFEPGKSALFTALGTEICPQPKSDCDVSESLNCNANLKAQNSEFVLNYQTASGPFVSNYLANNVQVQGVPQGCQ